MIYTGYDGLDTNEFQTWVAPENRKSDTAYGQARRSIGNLGGGQAEAATKRALFSWGGRVWSNASRGGSDQQHFGVTVAHCERGDLRPWANGVAVYSAEGRQVRDLPPSNGTPIRAEVIDELLNAIREDRSPAHDGRWGKATIEVCLAIHQSSREQREIPLQHQVPFRD
jgi:phthalate 4,5-cis-dihydrodiol dehydrogenase